MTLNELIMELEALPQSTVVPNGFCAPQSYRGFYEQLAFEPQPNVTVAAMLSSAREAVGTTYCGYKGGDYTMNDWTDVWLAEYGCSGQSITPGFVSSQIELADLRAENGRLRTELAELHVMYAELIPEGER